MGVDVVGVPETDGRAPASSRTAGVYVVDDNDEAAEEEEGDDDHGRRHSSPSDDDGGGGGVASHVGRASYPIPRPLSRILRAATADGGGGGGEGRADGRNAPEESSSLPSDAAAAAATRGGVDLEVARESYEEALSHLVGNSFQALDAMYFATPASIREKDWFSHRLCLRIEVDRTVETLTVTDLGCGMTRADLINGLGVGRLGRRAALAGRALRRFEGRDDGAAGAGREAAAAAGGTEEAGGEGSSERDDETEEDEIGAEEEDGSGTEDTAADDDDDAEEDDVEAAATDVAASATAAAAASSSQGSATRPPLPPRVGETGVGSPSPSAAAASTLAVPCGASDVGGFYAALCALGVGVRVGTKSQFDDYYEFQVGRSRRAGAGAEPIEPSVEDFSRFTIVRPMDEGSRPSSSNGYGRFSDVRGESGTRITIALSDAAIEAGMLDEENVLKPMLEKVLVTSRYSVAFSGDVEGAKSVVDASRTEEEAAAALQGRCGDDNDGDDDSDEADAASDDREPSTVETEPRPTVKERSKYIPLRLSLKERKMLRMVEAAMICSDYTSDVDRPFKSAARRIHGQLKGVTSVLRGMVTACDYEAGQRLSKEDNFPTYESFFRQMFEIARRHKIMNPEKMRTEYGKLIFFMQDAVSPSVQDHLSFSCKGPIETVHKFLEERGALALLDDELIDVATREVLAEKKSRAKINVEIKRKEKAVAAIKKKYQTARLSLEDIHLCLYSICDNDSFLNSNRVPIDKVIAYLQAFFSPGKIEEGYSLSIVSGKDGARLSHSHERQYYFALQSLTLWRDIVDDMFRLWHTAEDDLLSESVAYSLKDTGQGFQRVQQSPRTYRAMQQILRRVQGKVKKWVGSSVIHLGDHNVPNALSFIDKYTQVPRILGPIVSCLENLERICEEDDGIKDFVETGFGGVERLKKDILYDFFKSAFDGSGADNFYDAGSCIDGRLTSAWNWCSQLPNKPFYSIFKLTGFTGFDGEFK